MKRILPPTLLLICIGTMCLLHILIPFLKVIDYPINLLGILFILIGIWIDFAGSNIFKIANTTEMTFSEPSTLVTNGIYKISRNPMYLGLVQILVGVSIILGSITPFIIVIAFVVITDQWYIKFEEKVLKDKFGKEYLIYKSKVRRWI
ncbi:methyltransferase family protein [Clostridium neuense]|uniref:Methyltransferase family protein n=1 Tax=Clostridium neuense TaxID=1728934 RepID=A0ABW8TC18_9CLOT